MMGFTVMDSSIQKIPDERSADEGRSNTSLFVIAGFCVAAMLTILVGFAVAAPEDFKLAMAKILSFVVTPFILEPILFVSFFTAVVLLNRWRRKRDGEEWVYIMEDDVNHQSAQRSGVHDAVFTSPPSAMDESVELDIIDGLVEMGALDDAAERLAALSREILDSKEGLRVRLKLATVTEKPELVNELRALLEQCESRDQA